MGKFSSSSMLTRSSWGTATRINASYENIVNNRQTKLQRWLFGMIVGSAPFFFILFCWMFVSLCLNNLVRLYQYRKNQYRRALQSNDAEDQMLKTTI